MGNTRCKILQKLETEYLHMQELILFKGPSSYESLKEAFTGYVIN